MSLTLTRNAVQPIKRGLFQWINIIFNKVDEDRRANLGPDRVCAEWLLRNGGAVQWVNGDHLQDYNLLPSEDVKMYIQVVDATGSSIMHHGFGHFVGCNHIKKIIFDDCRYLENPALEDLSPLTSTLMHLQVSSCFNIDEKGLRHLTKLSNLRELLLSNLPYVKDKIKITDELRKGLPNCNVQFN